MLVCGASRAGLKIRKVKGVKGAPSDKTKLKLRTSKTLYTLVTDNETAAKVDGQIDAST